MVSPLRRCTPRSVVGQLADPLLVGAADDQGAHAVVETSLIVTTSPVDLGRRGPSTTLKLSLSTTSAPRSSASWSMSGWRPTRILRPLVEHVDGAVVVLADDHAVGRRRLGELVDLVAERGDVLAGLAKGVAELLVLRDGLGQLALGLEQALLERAHPLGCIGQAATELVDLLLEHGDLRL